MLIKYLDHVKKIDHLSRPYKGIVVSNEDPESIGRIKCYIPGLIEASIDKLPYCHPLNNSSLGGSPDCSGFNVPEVGTEVTIEFPFDSIYAPYYTGYWINNNNFQSNVFSDNYPNMYGFVDSTVSFFRVNKDQKYVEIYHVSGTTIRIDVDGNVSVSNPGDVTWDIGGSLYINVGVDTILKSGNNIVTESGKDTNSIVGGNYLNNTSSNHEIKIGGQEKVTSSGNMSLKSNGTILIDSGKDSGIKSGGSVGIKASSNINNEAGGSYTEKAASIGMSCGNLMCTPPLLKTPAMPYPPASPTSASVPSEASGVTKVVHELMSRISELENKVSELENIATQVSQDGNAYKTINKSKTL